MTVTRAYSCNLCGAATRNPDELYGVGWDVNHSFGLQPSESTENHLCKQCFDLIRSIGKDGKQPDKNHWPMAEASND